MCELIRQRIKYLLATGQVEVPGVPTFFQLQGIRHRSLVAGAVYGGILLVLMQLVFAGGG